MTATKQLEELIKEESKILIDSYGGPSYHAIQHIIRRMDVVLVLFWKSKGWSDKDVEEYREIFGFGWPALLKQYYFDINLDVNQPFPLMNDFLISWAESNIMFSGKIEFLKQLLAYEKADLIQIFLKGNHTFTFKYLHESTGLEQFDNQSRDFFREKIIEKMIEKKIAEKPFDEEDIKEKLREIIICTDNNLISYQTTPEIDEHYNRKGHFFLLRLQGYDDFGDFDTFGSIEYWKYVDLVELLVGIAIMHTEACLELRKTNPKVNLNNIMSYTYAKDETIKSFAKYLGVEDAIVEQILECITLNKDNYDYYLEYPGTPPPIYFQVSNNVLIRSVAGCLGNPFSLLNRELKRKYKKDYDKAVNKREERFREELFALLSQDQIVKIRKEINISFKGIKTDIDAVVYDKETGTLGLFQLKWQDPYAKSMKERFSRISNLFPKAHEWIDKIKFWISENTDKQILNALQISKIENGATEINEVCIFVLSRTILNYTGITLDDSAAWSSWYQLIESQTVIQTDLNDPIKEMFVKIKLFSPENRSKIEPIEKPKGFKMQVGKIKIESDEK